jgi:hypothetical protein
MQRCITGRSTVCALQLPGGMIGLSAWSGIQTASGAQRTFNPAVSSQE